MKISGLNTMEVNVEVNETDIVRVNLGDTAEIKVDAFRDKVFKGIVTEIGNTALNMMNSGVGASTEQVTNFSVKVMVLADSYQAMLTLQGDSPFRPGMSATVDILTQRVKGVSSIPIKAVTQREDSITHTAKVCVFVLDEQMHQAKLKFIEIGIQDDQYIEVIKGLEKTDKVITGPYDEISKGLNAGDAVVEGEPEMSKAES
jgi:HlyD family secretion protein